MIDHLIGQTIAGKYRVEARWREDATTKTYRAVQTLLDKPVTLKVVNPAISNQDEAARALQHEAKVLSRMANPHILNVLDFGKDETGTSFVVLEHAEGRTLREFLRDSGGLPLARAVNIVAQIANALAAAQHHKIVHGNLSSDKILIDDLDKNSETVKVLDFAQNSLSNTDDEQTIVRRELPIYRAPEQFEQANVLDQRSDIYALGVLLYEILATKPPFIADSAAALANKHLAEIPPSLLAARPDLPPAMEQIVQRALAKNPNQRFQTAGEFTEALNRAAKSGATEFASHAAMGNLNQAPPGQIAAAQTSNPNNPYKTAFVVLAGICLLSAIGIYITGGFRTTPTAQMNADPGALPTQPINPVSGNVENPGDLGVVAMPNGNLDPYALPPLGSVPGGAAPGGVAPPYPEGRIPPGVPFDTSGGQIPSTTLGEANNPFMQPLDAPINAQTNANARPTGNTNQAPNANARPAGNANAAASPRPNNSNAGATTTATPAPTAAPTPAPARPRASPAKPPAETAPPKSNSNGAAAQSDPE